MHGLRRPLGLWRSRRRLSALAEVALGGVLTLAFVAWCGSIIARAAHPSAAQLMESNARFILVQNRTLAPVDVFVIDQGRSRTCAESRIQSGQRKRLRVCAYYSVLGWGAAPEDQLTVGLGRVYDISWKGRLAVEEVFLE